MRLRWKLSGRAVGNWSPRGKRFPRAGARSRSRRSPTRGRPAARLEPAANGGEPAP